MGCVCSKNAPQGKMPQGSTPPARKSGVPAAASQTGLQKPPSSAAALAAPSGATAPAVTSCAAAPAVSPGTIAPAVSLGATTSAVPSGAAAPAVSPGTTTPAVSSGTTAPAVSPGTIAPAVSPGATTSAVTSGTTTPAVSSGTTAPAVTSGAAAPAVTSSATTPAVTSSGPAQNHPASATTSVTVADASSLWKQAFDRIPQSSKIYPAGKTVPAGSFVLNIIGEVETKKKECDSRRWFYNKGENKIFIVETLLVQLNRYATIGDIMLQHNPDIVALVWGGFRGLLQVGTAYVDQMRLVSESMEYLVHLLCCCSIYEGLYCQQNFEISGRLTECFVDLYESVLIFVSHTIKYLDHNTFGRIIKSFSGEISESLQKIKSNKAALDENIDIAEKEASSKGRSNHDVMVKRLEDLRKPMDDALRVAEVIYASIQDDKRTKILKWLSKVEYEGHHILSQRRRQEGTGLWLFRNDAFVQWKKSQSNKILWLRADAGFGKTILVSSIIDNFGDLSRSDDHVVAYFYCNYKETDRKDAASILRTLVKQFCVKKQDRTLPTLVAQAYKEREDRGHPNGSLLHEESTRLMIELSKNYQSTTLIVDALDECDRGTRKLLFSSLHKIAQEATRTKIVVTSRYDRDINDSFSRDLCYYIDDKDNSADINLYIDAELDRRCDASNVQLCDYDLLLGGNVEPELKEYIRSTLKAKSNGMFMWVNLQIMALCDAQTAGGVTQALKRMPPTLNDTYQQIMERVKLQDENSFRAVITILKWILCTQEACTTESVIQALAVVPRKPALNKDGLTWTVPAILGICKNLVVHDEALGVFRFAHFSVQEFLVHEDGFEQRSIKTYIAEACVTVLLYHHGEKTVLPALYTYAMRNWGAHVRHLESIPETLERLCKAFFTSSVAYNEWGRRIIKIEHDLRGEGDTVVPLFWVACYYKQHALCRILLAGSVDGLNSYNSHKHTPLSYAAFHGCEEIVQLLLEQEEVDVNCEDLTPGQTPLFFAAGSNYERVVRLLLKRKDVVVNTIDAECGMTPLCWAVHQGCHTTVQVLLQREDVDVNAYDMKYGRAPLSWAAQNGKKKMVQLLLQREDVDIHYQEPMFGMTPLLLAMNTRRKKVVKLLMEREEAVYSKDDDGRTLLSQVAGGENVVFLQLLLEGRDVDADSKSNNGRTPLSYAAEGGNFRGVQLLLKKGVDVGSKDNEGRTPLSYGAEKGNYRVVQLLLHKGGVDVDSEDVEYDRTLVSRAAEGGNDNPVQLLLERENVDVDSRSNSGRTPLSYAAEKGHDEVVQLLLHKDVDVYSKDTEYGRTLLSWAAEGGNKMLVQLLLERGDVDVDSKSNSGRTPLSYTAEKGHDKSVQLLLEKDVDVNSKDNSGRTPLSWAAEKGHGKVVQMLLQKGVDVGSKDNSDRTPLSWAAEKGHYGVVELLLGNDGVDADSKSNSGRTPLSYAAEKGHDGMVQLLLHKGGDVDLDSKDTEHGRTLLSWAAEGGNDMLVQMLLERENVDADPRSNSGRTPLSWAAEKGHDKVVQMLLQKGVDVNSKDNEGRTPLSWAAEKGHDKVVQMLLQKGVDVNSKDNEGRTPLSWAAEKGHDKVVQMLLQKGVDVDSKDNEGRTPLSWAAEGGNEMLVQLLLQRQDVGADSKSNSGRTPLSWAAEKGHKKVVRLLVKKEDVDVNSKDNDGRTSLSWAAENGHYKVVKLLLEVDGVDLNSNCNGGRTPISWAVQKGHQPVVALLLMRDDVDLNSKDTEHGRTILSLAAEGGDYRLVMALLDDDNVDADSKCTGGRTPLSYAAGKGHGKIVGALLFRRNVDVDSKDNEGRTPLSYATEGGHHSVAQRLKAKMASAPGPSEPFLLPIDMPPDTDDDEKGSDYDTSSDEQRSGYSSD